MNKIQICNLALLHLGKGEIQDIDEDTTSGRACKATYDIARRKLLEMAEWNFATRTQALVAIDDDQEELEYEYAYAWPNDCLVARYLVNEASDDVIGFKVQLDEDGIHKIILTDEDDIHLCYTADMELTGNFSSAFCEALSVKMAMAMCPILVSGSDPGKLTQLQNYFVTFALPEALKANAMEGHDTHDYECPIVEERE